MAYGDRLRLLMVLGKVAAGSLSSPATKLSGAKHIIYSRLPTLISPTLGGLGGSIQSRIPNIVSARRPPFVLRAQLAFPVAMPQPPQHPMSGAKPCRKRKHITPEVEARLSIQLAARENDFHAAFEAFDAAVASGLKLPSDAYVTLMFLASGGDDWEALVDKKHAGDQGALGNLAEFLGRCEEVLTRMREAGHKAQEMCYTALARRDALLGDPSAAFAHASCVIKEGLTPRLRCFTPALVAFAVHGDCDNAFAVYNAVEDAGIEPTELEFRRLLQAATLAPQEAAWEPIQNVLKRMSQELTMLQPETIEQVRNLFASSTAEGALGGKQRRWKVEACEIAEDGGCDACGDRLEALDLSEHEYEEFKDGVAELAARQERQPNDFKVFVDWLEAHGPFGAIVDAANVAFYGQNFEAGRFSFPQIEAVVDRLQQDHPSLRPLVILHTNRTKAPPALSSTGKSLLKRLEDEKCFYAAPHGSNDDWYWMYAAVAAGPKGLLVSNDEMRDHLFHMLAPKFFNKWKQRHQMRYKFAGAPSSLTIESPPPFTTCIQQMKSGGWVFPCVDGTWVCVQPEE